VIWSRHKPPTGVHLSVLAGLVLGLLALGPALGRGFVLSYDLVFVPSPPIGTFDLGVTGGPARAVPSDLVVALLARVAPVQIVEKVILLAIFATACAGAAALVGSRGEPGEQGGGWRLVLGQLVAGVFYAWNPFVAERLIMGQWAMLLGYAGLPWVVRELAGWSGSGRLRLGRLVVAILSAAVGGFAAMSITALAALPVAFCGAGPVVQRFRRTVITAAVLLIASLPWVIPSFLVPVLADPTGANAFAARADTPFGAIGSLVMLSGIWNAQAVPAGYGGVAVSVAWLIVALVALGGYVLVARARRVCAGLGVAAFLGFCVAALGTWGPTLASLRAAISFWPAFALLRDGQQFIAPLALAESAGLGAAVLWLLSVRSARSARSAPAAPAAPAAPRAPSGAAALLGVLALLAPLVLLPGLAWGAFGRLRAVEYPDDWLTARQVLDSRAAGSGSVLLLPWAQYRSYPWNHGEPVFDPWPRLLSRPMVWNDALRVGSTTVAAESALARRLGPVIASGRPLTPALLAAGVRFVVVDAGPLLGRPRARLADLARLPGARVMMASNDLIVFRLTGR
jgi:hypothetical protein